ncbi:unnamed protein product [Blepharisma stoltei]|uniref:Uncharacterized protein n=1 Tax=Blepharisma stoltei TaxID=1481888 RepID=A0AAU9J2Z1_9CILI|nr:unnamed protein product [Blepharisma stoltei]
MMNPSSMTRIQRLKKEIAEIDQKLESATERPTPSPIQSNFPLQISTLNFKKNQERDEIQQRINLLRISVSKEEAFNNQLTEIQNKLRSLGKQKQFEVQNCKISRDPLSQKAAALKDLIQQLHDEYQSTSNSVAKRQKLKESAQQGKLQAYQNSLIPLEAESSTLLNKKQKLVTKQQECSEEIKRIENCIKMCKEELDSRYITRAEYIAQREEDEEVYERLRLEYADELEYFDEEVDLVEQFNFLTQQKEGYIEKIQNLEWKLGETNRNIQEYKSKIEDCRDSINHVYSNTPNFKDQQEIEKLESFLNIKCRNYGLETLQEVIMRVNCNENFDIEEEILRVQLKEMIKNQTRMSEEWEAKESLLMERLKGEEDPETVYKLEAELNEHQQKYRNRMAAVEQWKSEVESALGRPRPIGKITVLDKAIIDEFKISSLSLIDDFEQRKSLENLINIYIQKIISREKYLVTINAKLEEKRINQARFEDCLYKLIQEKAKFEKEKIEMRKNLMKFIMKEKNLTKRLDGSTTSESGAGDFRLKQQAHSLHHNVQFWEKLIAKETATIENFIKPALLEYEEMLKKMKKEILQINLQIKETEDEYQSVECQIEKILECKRQDMLDSLEEINNQIQQQEGGENKLFGIKESIDERTGELLKLQEGIDAIDAASVKVLSELEQEEAMLRTQKQVLETSLIKIQHDKKQLEELENKAGRTNESQHTSRSPFKPENLNEKSRSRSFGKIIKPKSQDIPIPPTNILQFDIPEKPEDSPQIEPNPYFEFVEKTLGKQAQMISERIPLIPAQVRSQKKYYRFNLEDTTQSEKNFYERIMPLLEGAEIYKKFSQHNSLKLQAFDPLDSVRNPPEACGYGIKYFRLHKSLQRIDIRQPLKPGFESSISIDQIMAPIIPQITMTILKIQKKLGQEDLEFTNFTKETQEKYDLMKEKGYLDHQSPAFKEICKDCAMYPFHIALIQGGRIELIAKSYVTFKQWINGINALIRAKRQIPKLRRRIESYTSV